MQAHKPTLARRHANSRNSASRAAAKRARDPNGRCAARVCARSYQPLMPRGPKAMEQSFVQGATLVYDGTDELFAHYDFSSGDHADLEEVVRVATTGRWALPLV